MKDPAGATIAGYTYDSEGRRVTETHGSTTTALYYSDRWQVLEERDLSSGTATSQRVLSPFYVDDILTRDDHDPTTIGTSLNRQQYLTHDINYNTTSVTQSNGNSIERYVYSPYGVVVVEDSIGVSRGDGTASNGLYGTVYLHQGLRLEFATGIYDARLRPTYSPLLGRFEQQDPAGYVDGSNRYQFVQSTPVMKVDPSGQNGYENRMTIWGGVSGLLLAGAGLLFAVAAGVVVAPVAIPVLAISATAGGILGYTTAVKKEREAGWPIGDPRNAAPPVTVVPPTQAPRPPDYYLPQYYEDEDGSIHKVYVPRWRDANGLGHSDPSKAN